MLRSKSRQSRTLKLESLTPRQLMAADLAMASFACSDALPVESVVAAEVAMAQQTITHTETQVVPNSLPVVAPQAMIEGPQFAFNTVSLPAPEAEAVMESKAEVLENRTLGLDAAKSKDDAILQPLTAGPDVDNALAADVALASVGQSVGQSDWARMGGNDTRSGATNIGNVTGRSVSKTGRVGDAGDPRDYWKFNVTRTQTVTVSLSRLSADIDIRLVDSRGRVLATSTRGGSASESLTQVLNSGTYFVEVVPYRTAKSAYTLRVAAGNPGNDVMSGATNIGVVRETTVTRTGRVGGTDPVDYFRFVPTINGFALTGEIGVRIQLSGMSQDLDLYVYDSAGRLIRSSRASGNTTETLNLPLTQGSEYFVLVKPYNGAVSNYTLRVTT